MNRLPRLRPAIAALEPYHPPMENRAGLRLDFNENTLGCSPRALEALRALDAEALARYPDYTEAEAELSAGWGHTPSTCLLTNGVDDAIQLAVTAFAGPGDEIVLLEPCFSIYRFYAQQSGARLRRLRYRDLATGPGQRAFALDQGELRAAIGEATRLVFIASPNNPTGHLTPPETLLELARDFPETAFFADEAYAEFVAESYRGLLPQVAIQPNLLVARTYSKAYGIAGLRLGCLFAHPALMPALRAAHSPYNVNLAAMAAARAAMRDLDWMEAYRREVIASRGLIERAFSAHDIVWWQSAANFVLFHAGERCQPLLEQLRRQGILLRDRRADHPGTLRITCGTRPQTERALAALLALWKETAHARTE